MPFHSPVTGRNAEFLHEVRMHTSYNPATFLLVRDLRASFHTHMEPGTKTLIEALFLIAPNQQPASHQQEKGQTIIIMQWNAKAMSYLHVPT